MSIVHVTGTKRSPTPLSSSSADLGRCEAVTGFSDLAALAGRPLEFDGGPFEPGGETDGQTIFKAHDALLTALQQAAEFPRAGSIADLGSGLSGSYFVHRYRSLFPDTAVTFLDSNSAFIDELQLKDPRDRKVVGNIRTTGLPDGAFELAYAGHVIPPGSLSAGEFHRAQMLTTFREVARILAPGALFLFTGGGEFDGRDIELLDSTGFRVPARLLRVYWFGQPNDLFGVRKKSSDSSA